MTCKRVVWVKINKVLTGTLYLYFETAPLSNDSVISLQRAVALLGLVSKDRNQEVENVKSAFEI